MEKIKPHAKWGTIPPSLSLSPLFSLQLPKKTYFLRFLILVIVNHVYIINHAEVFPESI